MNYRFSSIASTINAILALVILSSLVLVPATANAVHHLDSSNINDDTQPQGPTQQHQVFVPMMANLPTFPAEYFSDIAIAEKHEQSMVKLEEFMALGKDGTIEFSANLDELPALPGGEAIDPEVTNELMASLAKTNELILAGEFDPSEWENQEDAELLAALGGCIGNRGPTGYGWRGWAGTRYRFNSCDTAIVLRLLAGGSSLATMCGVVPRVGKACGVAGFIMQVGSYYIRFLNWYSHGKGFQVIVTRSGQTFLSHNR